MPLTAATTGVPSVGSSLRRPASGRELDGVAAGLDRGDVEAAAEDVARAGDDDAGDVGVGVGGEQLLRDRRDDVRIEQVALGARRVGDGDGLDTP